MVWVYIILFFAGYGVSAVVEDITFLIKIKKIEYKLDNNIPLTEEEKETLYLKF
jgi:hypothetical protein